MAEDEQMNFETLFFDNSRAVADIVSDMIGEDADKYNRLYDFVMKDENVYARRASRVLCINAEKYPQLFDPYMDETIRSLDKLESTTITRCLMKILTIRPVPEDEELQGILMDYCFRKLPDPKQEIAIRVYSMMILYELSKLIPEIRNELALMIEQALPYGTAAIKCTGNRLLFKLKRY